MTSKIPEGHVSVALGVIYFIGKVLEFNFSEENFDKFSAEVDIYVNESSYYSQFPDAAKKRAKDDIESGWPIAYGNIVINSENADLKDITLRSSSSYVGREKEIIFCIHTHIGMNNQAPFRIRSSLLSDYVVMAFKFKNPQQLPRTIHLLARPPYENLLELSVTHPTSRNSNGITLPRTTARTIEWFMRTLSSEKLSSYLINDGGIFKIPGYFWLTEESEDVLNHNVHTAIKSDGQIRIGKPCISVKDIDRIVVLYGKTHTILDPKTMHDLVEIHYSKEEAIDTVTASSSNSLNKGGAPPRYDEVSFIVIASKIIFEHGRPNSRAELARIASDAYEAEGLPNGRPSDDWAKKKISAFWRKMGLGDDR